MSSYNKEYEMEGLDETLKDIKSGSEVALGNVLCLSLSFSIINLFSLS